MATPLNEPTLHLTVGVNNPTGADFLSWFVQRLRASETVREDLPHLEGPTALAKYAERLKTAIEEAWRPDLVDEYMSHLDSTSRARPQFLLPWTATEDVLPPGDFHVRWTAPRNVRIVDESDAAVAFETLGRRWRFAGEARGMLEALNTGQEYTLIELADVAASSGIAADAVRAFVRELVDAGLVGIR